VIEHGDHYRSPDIDKGRKTPPPADYRILPMRRPRS
jgi:hypothetical protein